MTGVEILSSYEVVVKYGFNWSAFWITIGSVLGIMLIIGIISWIFDECSFGVVPACFIFGLFFGAIAGVIVAVTLSTPEKYITEYKVFVQDEVSITEFNNKYEVIGQEDKIWIVREKNQ